MNRRPGGLGTFFDTYTRDLKAEDLQRLFTRDTPEAYRFFTRGADLESFKRLPWYKRGWAHARLLFMAFTMKLSPARRIVYAAALIFLVVGLIDLLDQGRLPDGTVPLIIAFVLMNFLALLEVADRLSLKNDLEIARDIQQAMLPSGLYSAPGFETIGLSRPANTVGGDLYDILPLDDGRVVIVVGDVSGKGSPAALLMALLVAMLRTLVDEKLEPAALVTRLNLQVCRHAPGSRFITLFYGVYQPASGELTYISAGHMPPLLLRADGSTERLTEGGIALGMFEQSAYHVGRVLVGRDELVAVYSDGITEAENPSGHPFDEDGLETVLKTHRSEPIASMGAAVVRAVERHSADTRLADDLTILLLRRS